MQVPVIGPIPQYANDGDAGADLTASETVTLRPGERTVVGTGVRIALPNGTCAMVTPRSGLAARAGLSIVNAPGIVDAGYRGEIKVCLINLDPKREITIEAGDRIAQLVVIPFVRAEFCQVETLDATARGEGGYGSTGGSELLREPQT